jgi:hypothetical protein
MAQAHVGRESNSRAVLQSHRPRGGAEPIDDPAAFAAARHARTSLAAWP